MLFAVTEHAEILDSDWGHIFRLYRRTNNKKSHSYFRENGKNRRLQGICRPLEMDEKQTKTGKDGVGAL